MNAPNRDRLNWWLATCAGTGLSPVFPGSVGALWGVAIYLACVLLLAEPWQTLGVAAALLAVSVATIRLAPWAEQYFGEEDSGKFVTDEVAGFLFTVLLFHPSLLVPEPSLTWTILWAYPITRVLDMVKPPPARRLEYLPRGWGVLADDLMDSFYAAVVLYALAAWRPAWFS